ncbi:MAG: OmpA family protein [Deltaproteobacteria bacterium]|nr:OmpA family protein [Deltaproteobacteria bacterium]
MSRLSRRILFPVNVWPPMVDAITLVVAALVLIALVGFVAQRGLSARLVERDRELSRIREEKARVERRLKALATSGMVEVVDGKVILAGELLFDSGSAEVTPKGRGFIAQLAPPLLALLQHEPDQVVLIGGHADDRPIRNEEFDSNWELSAARAVAVARALEDTGLPPGRVVAAGFGQHHPRVPNEDEASRRRNRRIEVLLVPMHVVSSSATRNE